ncbi:MAG: hypothetical protein LBO80_07695 [Treponema sp.]|jgi:hypothetical protein|nr:hypothetical protein [Treponema sp.]
MKKAIFALVVLAVLLAAACTTITVPVTITDNAVGDKIGETTESFLFGRLYISGSGALSAAAANGGVTKIATVEQRVTRNPFMTKVTTIVTGN